MIIMKNGRKSEVISLNTKNKIKAVDIKTFIIPLIIITAIFIISDIIMINSIKSHYYELRKNEAFKLARSYAQSLSNSAEAHEVVNQLLDDKVLVAGKTVASYYGLRYSNELLIDLANTLDVDEIDYYNQQGELIYSNLNEVIGWQIYDGHPIHDFMLSNDTSLVEDIRQDVITGNYYKYGYLKFSDGSLIQVGVKADKVQSFLGRFEMKVLLEEMKEDEDAKHINFINSEFLVLGSTVQQLEGTYIDNQAVKAAILEDKEYSLIGNHNEGQIYEVYVPMMVDGIRIGALAVGYSLDATIDVVRKVSLLGLLSLTLIYISLLYNRASIYKNNKSLFQIAYFDSLTGLPNQFYLQEFLTNDLEQNKHDKKALLLVNCINFKIVNMTYGYEFGDELLKKLGQKLRELEGIDNTLFRFSAERFILYIKDYKDKEDLISICDLINELFSNAFTVNGSDHYLGAQIGIVEIDNTYNNVNRLLKDASIAINHINVGDSLNYTFFSEDMENKLQREELIEKELRSIIVEDENKKIYLQYQPQLDLKTNKIIGFEALARMNSEQFGSISPLEFIDIAERKQLIVPLGNLILKTACEFLMNLNQLGYENIKVAVNISGMQLLREDFTHTVINIVEKSGVKASNLELEITESILLDNFEIINEKLREMREHQIDIALDDFGTGYSSFSRLRELNVDSLKIDRTFISKISEIDNNELITSEIIAMAHKCGLIVVAEGVELQEQKDYLIKYGCDILQGYLFSKPLNEEEALIILQDQNNL